MFIQPNPAVFQQAIQDAFQLWAQTADHANPDRCLEMTDMLHDWTNKLFMGESNADALFSIVAFISEWCMATARETNTNPQMLVCTVTLGLQQGLAHYLEAQDADDA
jgi:hypothetical protein